MINLSLRVSQRGYRGFTIVELLIVIVVIAILAAITLVAYTGVTKSAIDSSMKSDLRNAIMVIDTDKTLTDAYPSSLSVANGGKGVRASKDNTLTYSAGRGETFCLSVENSKNNTKYHSSNISREITEGGCGVFVSTLAGTHTPFDLSQGWYVNGTLAEARFGTTMRGIDVDSAGNIFIADARNMAIRKITPDGTVSTLTGRLPGDPQAGTPGHVDGGAGVARFWDLYDLAVAPDDSIYVTDKCWVRKITQAGDVSTVAGSSTCGYINGSVSSAQFRYMYGIDVDAGGNIFVADRGNHAIRKITPAGQVTTLAGTGAYGYVDGAGSVARFHNLAGIALGPDNILYVADENNDRVRKVTQSGDVSTFVGGASASIGQAGDGTGAGAFVYRPAGVAVDSDRNVYVTTTSYASVGMTKSVRKVAPSGAVVTLAGDAPSTGAPPSARDGAGSMSQFGPWVYGVAVDGSGTIYLTDQQYSIIRKVTQ